MGNSFEQVPQGGKPSEKKWWDSPEYSYSNSPKKVEEFEKMEDRLKYMSEGKNSKILEELMAVAQHKENGSHASNKQALLVSAFETRKSRNEVSDEEEKLIEYMQLKMREGK